MSIITALPHQIEAMKMGNKINILVAPSGAGASYTLLLKMLTANSNMCYITASKSYRYTYLKIKEDLSDYVNTCSDKSLIVNTNNKVKCKFISMDNFIAGNYSNNLLLIDNANLMSKVFWDKVTEDNNKVFCTVNSLFLSEIPENIRLADSTSQYHVIPKVNPYLDDKYYDYVSSIRY